MTSTAKGTFDITMQSGLAQLDGAVNRFEMLKTFHGDLQGTGTGIMLAAGDPQAGDAGYVAIEVIRGQLSERQGGYALQQFGLMHAGSQTLQYQVVPGSGTEQLIGIVGSLHLRVDEDGTHHYELEYDL